MTDAVIFSAWVPQHLLHRGEQYLQYLYEYFLDCDIFCGLNVQTSPAFLDMIEAYKRKGLKIEYKCVAPSMSSSSDMSGFQAALSLYKFTNKNYNTVFFSHTKSITHPEKNHKEGVEHMVVSFHKNRQRASRLIHSNPRIGGWTAVGRLNYEHLSLNKIEEYFPFPCQALPLTYVLTNYAMRGSLIKQFIDGCNPTFFTTTYDALGYNRYFFEFYFPNIISKMGYIPLVDELWEVSTQQVARIQMKADFDTWKAQRIMTQYLEYIDSFEGMKP